MKTLEQVKKEKNYLAHKKGYPMDPEGFSYDFLFQRFEDELRELYDKITFKEAGETPYDSDIKYIPESQFYCNDRVMGELGDLSNFIDYIATKIITGYPTKYQASKQGFTKIEDLRSVSER